jgi:hypothetical protein
MLAIATPARAQAPCPACAQGDALIDRYSLQPLRPLAGELAALPLDSPVTPEQYARVVELRTHNPALLRLGALDDPQLTSIAIALCRAPDGACVVATVQSLRCLADRCAVAFPHPPRPHDIIAQSEDCHQYSTHHRSPRFGVGMDWATGWQRSRYPTDTGAWSFGIEGRMRLTRSLGAVARVDRVAGRDEATDVDGNGHDDVATGTITRITALAGPSIVLDNTRYEDTTRFLRLDLLGGYVKTGSPGREDGPAAGADLAYQIWAFRFGLRFVQGFGDAHNASMLLAHLGFSGGSVPPYSDETDCGGAAAARSTPLALGFDFPLVGYGISSELGYMVPGLGLEAAWHVTHAVDLLARGDLLVYPGYNRDRVLHQALLAGIRIDHDHKKGDISGFFTTVMAGYTHGIGFTPTSVGDGPIGEVSFAWGGQGADGAAYLRLHLRSGLSSDNLDYRAVFLSFGGELRLDPSRWRDRD